MIPERTRRRGPTTGEARSRRDTRWALAFVLVQIACQILLIVPGLGEARIAIRAASLTSSIVMLALLRSGGALHPATRPATVAFAILVLSFFHPTTNSVLAGTAQIALNVSVLGTVYWASSLAVDSAGLGRVLTAVWAFQVASATVGILQAVFPGRFQPPLSTFIQSQGLAYVEGLQITLASGEKIFRPMGLSDIPGGASNAGFQVVLFGLTFMVREGRLAIRVLAMAALVVGMTCIYLSMVRVTFVRLLVCLVVYVGILLWRGRLQRFGVVAAAGVALLVGSFLIAVAIGGTAVASRFESLLDADPGVVYQKNRGMFLEYTVYELLPRFPLGAGLGRYGMMNAYFGDTSDPQCGSLWAEIQWTGWLLDGGVPLVLAYGAAMLHAPLVAWRVSAIRKGPGASDLDLWAGMIFAYDLGAVATTFSYPLFQGQAGVEFWFLNGLLFAAWQRERRARPVAPLRDAGRPAPRTLPVHDARAPRP